MDLKVYIYTGWKWNQKFSLMFVVFSLIFYTFAFAIPRRDRTLKATNLFDVYRSVGTHLLVMSTWRSLSFSLTEP